MIDSKAYHKINEYLDKGDIKRLRVYLDKEYNEMYINKACKALYNLDKKTTAHPLCFSEVSLRSLLLKNNYSIFLLNSRELLTSYSLITGGKLYNIGAFDEKKYLERINSDEKGGFSPITSIEFETEATDPGKSEFRIKSKTDKIGSTFHKRMLDLSKAVLGNDIEYSLMDNYPALTAKSDKGKGYILGIGNRKD